MSKSFEELISKANQKTLKKVSVSNAQDEPVLQAVKAAKEQNIATAILVGDEAKIREIAASIDMDLTDFEIINEPDTKAAALKAVELVHNGKADILLKGLLETKTFLKSVLNKEVGLRTGKMLSHVCVFEIEGINRLLFFTDVAFNTYPTLADKVNIINNAVEVAHACGIECPKVAPLCAVETVNPKMQPTVDADNLTKMYEGGDFKGCQIYGPLSMDLAIDPEAAVHKGVTNPVAGHADILLFPNIDAGNITYKILVRTAKVKIGNVLVGTSAPVVLTSRSDDFQTKLNSIALATVIAGSITD
ncbi:phosphate butyryltransferase [Coprococcus comes]|uniref:phosphate butyryltransferase n=1 Tax=Coprococcus comes TaxID=410072 RepID=UPI00156DA16D|nr:phosphate butyryltransferase [Coprococcus comes]MCB6473009.1 phosphate butyryltransferase [Coprococcus comes]NSC15004.1 phosphate butyryltransferase [Coprococcus comes]NSC18163.1 phosphate butyryltransferase [Coprococcus comes]NSC30540.1 phosphate butyryltransferase [Coprococcus comes]NSC68169.1 phosphate butyryltransferase [Coprococcus comes]